MSREKNQVPCTSLYMRAPVNTDKLVEAMVQAERRTKTVILSLALEEYAERHHPALYKRYTEAGS